MVNGDEFPMDLMDYFTCGLTSRHIKPRRVDDKIVGLDINGEKVVELYSPIIFEKAIIVPRYIEVSEQRPNTYIISHDKPNDTTLFIRPIVLTQQMSHFISGRTLNCYMRYGDSPNEDYMYMMVRYIPDTKMFTYEKMLEGYPLVEEIFDVDIHFTCIKFKIPDACKEDVALIRAGKYSRISDGSKNKIMSYYSRSGAIKGDPMESEMGKILYRLESLRRRLETTFDVSIPEDAELYEMYNEEKETFFPDLMCINNYMDDIKRTRERSIPSG